MVWIAIALVLLFMMGMVLGLRISPREKALGKLRDKARKMGLHPRLIPAPAWTEIPKASADRASMVAYYSLLVPQGNFELTQARVIEQTMQVILGKPQLDGTHVPLDGVYAIDLQANCIGVYWDETADYTGLQLEAMRQFLQQLASSAV